ncbi:MAG: UPF0146 family protein [Haloarculaceae archaeon]
MRDATIDAIAARLADFDTVVEVGIGHRSAVAGTLADAGVTVTATDISERSVPDGVTFVCDDVTDPDQSVYAEADAIYALNCPPELHRPIADLARAIDAAFLFTTLGADPPTIPVRRETLPGETLFVFDSRPTETP